MTGPNLQSFSLPLKLVSEDKKVWLTETLVHHSISIYIVYYSILYISVKLSKLLGTVVNLTTSQYMYTIYILYYSTQDSLLYIPLLSKLLRTVVNFMVCCLLLQAESGGLLDITVKYEALSETGVEVIEEEGHEKTHVNLSIGILRATGLKV